MTRRYRARGVTFATVIAAVATAGFVYLSPTTSSGDIPPKPAASSTTTAVTGQAAAALEQLPIKGRAPKTGYDRARFGAEWTDDVTVQGGHNSCDTRSDVLRRDLSDLVVKEGTQGCLPLSGTLLDPYTGQQMLFRRGEDSASLIHGEHLVALSNSWQTGAQQLDADQRQNLANDPLNIWAVSGAENTAKGDGDAATWLPPNAAVRCDLIAAQIAVKTKYHLWVTPPEAEAMRRVLSACPSQQLPTSATAQTPEAIR